MAQKYLKIHGSLERTGLLNGFSSIDVEEIEVNGKNEKSQLSPVFYVPWKCNASLNSICQLKRTSRLAPQQFNFPT
jgi:hypothetical protein